MNEDHPGLTVAGGMASSPTGPDAPALFLNGEVKEKGAVAVPASWRQVAYVVS